MKKAVEKEKELLTTPTTLYTGLSRRLVRSFNVGELSGFLKQWLFRPVKTEEDFKLSARVCWNVLRFLYQLRSWFVQP